MSGVNQAFLNTSLSFASTDDLSAFDVSGIVDGQLAWVGGEIGRFYSYHASSVAAITAAIIATANSIGTGSAAVPELAGRWFRVQA